MTGRTSFLCCVSRAICFALLLTLCCLPADAAGFLPTSAWTVSLQPASAGSNATCGGTNTYDSYPDEALEAAATFSFSSSDTASLRFATVPEALDPYYLTGMTVPPKPLTNVRRAWFDNGSAFAVRLVNNGLAYLEIDFGDSARLLQDLAGARELTIETAPARSGLNEYGQPATSPSETMSFGLSGMTDFAASMQACLQAHRTRQNFVLPAPPKPAVAAASLAGRTLPQVIEDRAADVQAASRGPAGSAALANALLRLGAAQADAFQLGDARESLSTGLSQAALERDTSEQAQARARLIATDLGLERLDEAETLAHATPDPRPWLAAATVMRGNHAGGLKQFLSLLGERTGQSFGLMAHFQQWNQRRDVLRTVPPLRPIRALLLLWAGTALGQEDWISYDAFHSAFYGEMNGPHGSGPLVPAAVIAATLFGCLDPEMLRDDTPLSADDRTMLGQAAFIRGESLRRAGNLSAAGTDFAYAESEFAAVTGAQGWAYKARIARLARAADLGSDGQPTLDKAEPLLRSIEQDLGQRSMVWLEAASLVADLRLRMGDTAGSEALSLQAADLAAAALTPAHSLTRKLWLQAAEARLAQRDMLVAGRLAAQALGFPTVPTVAADRLDALSRDQAVRSDPAGMLQELGKLLGVAPQGRLDGPATARIQARRADRMLTEIVQTLPESPERTGLRAVLAYADAQYRALDHADDKVSLDGRHLNESPDTLAGLLQKMEFRPLTGPLDPSVLSLLMTLVPDTAQFMRPDLAVPADFRPAIRYGTETTEIEYLLRGLHRRLYDPALKTADRQTVLDIALRVMAASTRGDASAMIAAQFYTGAAGVMGNQALGDPDRARQAAALSLYAQRLRSMLRLRLDQNAPGAAERRLYSRALASAASASVRISTAFSGDASFSYINATHTGEDDVSVRAFARNLAPHQAVLVWLPLETSTQVFVIGPQMVVWHELPEGRRAIGRRVANIRKSLETAASLIGSTTRPSLEDFPAVDARALYKVLFGPLEAELRDVTHIFCAQLGVVGGLPLQLLRTDAEGAGAAPAWLADRFQITRMPGLLNPVVVYGHTGWVLGNPATPLPSRLLLAIGAPETAGADSGPAAFLGLPPLPNAAGEIRLVAQALGATGDSATILQGEAATRSGVMAGLRASAHNVVLFATHGLVGGEDANIGEPALVLASPQKRAWFDDGLLHASDIAGSRTPADLVILSACSTASLGEDGGEPLAGLASAFMIAGGHSVVASIWVLSDDTAGQLTSAVVRGRYREHQDVAEALQKSMAALRTSGGSDQVYAHPVFWAPFVAIGLPWLQPGPPPATVPRAASPAALPRASLPPGGSRAAPNPVPLDAEASRLIQDGFAAEQRGDCALGSAKIRALGELLHGGGRSVQQQNQIQNAVMNLILQDQHCEILKNAARAR
ncbi:MAG TPA: CHAT domain-containing protein [Acetobacteraceae bacterium]|nr:CHAT domain-containing protein [Acetobacteraceae bacterium]